MNVRQETERLFELLNAEDLPPGVIVSELEQLSVESKNELVSKIASTFDPEPSGQILARLTLILTEENKTDIERAFITNIRSSDPQARKASLYGLAKLNYSGFIDLAILSLRDDSDQVSAIACDLLIPKAKQDPKLRKILQDVYSIHKDDTRFHMTVSLLKAHGITQ